MSNFGDHFERMRAVRAKHLKEGWGSWRLENGEPDGVGKQGYLVYHFPLPSVATYEIPLTRVTDVAQVYDWLCHLHEKTWLTDADFRDFFRALIDLGRVFR